MLPTTRDSRGPSVSPGPEGAKHGAISLSIDRSVIGSRGMGRAARLVSLLVVALSVVAAPTHAADPSLPRVGLSAGERDFIATHWGRAIPPQGLPPARFSPIERSLQPE